MGFDKPDLGFIVHVGAPQSPVAYYQQIGRAGRGVDRAEVILLPGPGGPGHLGLLRRSGLPARAGRPGHAGRARRDPAVARRPGGAGRPQPQPPGDDAQGARRGRRRTPGHAAAGWRPAGSGRYDRGALRAGRGGAGRRAAGDARLHRHRRVPRGVPAAPPRRPRGAAVRPLRQLHRTALARRGLRAGRRAGPGTAAAPGGRGAPAPDVADRDAGARGLRPDLRRLMAEPGRALGRLTDIGWGNRLRQLLADGRPGRPGAGRDVRRPSSRCWPPGTGRPARSASSPSAHAPARGSSRDLGGRIAEIGRLPYLGRSRPTARWRPRQHNSAQRLQAP